ncbi:hypothetical protein J6590_053258 [Homalodisca vitripennis]|nr:hypothetical protein J6590_053258 [Homalodisca vitripennis]
MSHTNHYISTTNTILKLYGFDASFTKLSHAGLFVSQEPLLMQMMDAKNLQKKENDTQGSDHLVFVTLMQSQLHGPRHDETAILETAKTADFNFILVFGDRWIIKETEFSSVLKTEYALWETIKTMVARQKRSVKGQADQKPTRVDRAET